MEEGTALTERIWNVHIDASGRVLLPVELRRMLDVEPGDSLTWVKDENGLHLKSFDQAVNHIQAFFKSLSPPEDVWSEQLIAERRREAAREQRS